MGNDSPSLPPLRPPEPAMVPIQTLVTVGRITLTASDIPRGVLKEFYTRILGLTFVEATDSTLRFRHQQREILLDREREAPGRAGLMIRGFGAALMRLRSCKVGFEILHTDGGLTRVAIVKDPAGNWIHLLETRAF